MKYRIIFNGYTYRVQYLSKNFFTRKQTWKDYEILYDNRSKSVVYETDSKDGALEMIKQIELCDAKKVSAWEVVE